MDPPALRAARLSAGLTQHELARLVGVAGGERISRWELGTSAPRPQVLPRLAEALGVATSDLLVSLEEPDLRRLRTSTGLSAREVAVRARMSVPTLVRWESGRLVNVPSATAVERLAVVLGVSAEGVRRAITESRRRRHADGAG